ncbi:MAG: ribonuclease HII [Rhodothermaceae bacterium]
MKEFDNKFLTSEIKRIAGVDEAGRGPLAGPVVAAAVIFDDNTVIEKINDSKKLSEKVRNILFDEILEKSRAYGIGIIDNNEIDEINILQASLKAMKIACSKLQVEPDLILIDGNKSFYTHVKTETIVKGDAKSQAIAAASILAKVTRDRLMEKYAENFPEYNWKKNKGYPTKEHREAVKKFGATELHRKSFLRKILEENEEKSLF